MSRQRHISWSAALRDLRGDRASISPEDRRHRVRQDVFAKIAANLARKDGLFRPLTPSGRFDYGAIMQAAIRAARRRRAVTGEIWKVCIAAALAGTWSAAKVLRRLSTHRAPPSAIKPTSEVQLG